MRKPYLFAVFLLGAMLFAAPLSSPNVTGRWSGTLQMDGQNGPKPAYSIFQQDGNKLSGSVGPDESEQDEFEGGKVEGDKLTFDVPQGPNGEGSLHVEMHLQGDQMTGRVTWSGPPPHTGSGRISLKRVVEKQGRMRQPRSSIVVGRRHWFPHKANHSRFRYTSCCLDR